ncbi:MAG: AbgT family transporter, partial [Bacteroidota bacterium]
MTETSIPKKNWSDRFLSVVERVGNALPHPATLFAIMCLLVMVVSWLVSLSGLSVKHPGTGEQITAFNLLSVEGLHMILTKLVTNFTVFAPLGTVLVALLGIGIAEGSGLIGSLLRMLV